MHNSNSFTRLILVAISLLFFSACNSNKNPDVSDIKVDVQIYRFDKDLFALKQNADFDSFKKKYGNFLSLYSNKVIGLGDPKDSNYMDYLNKFLYDSTMTLVDKKVNQVFPDLQREEKQISKAFQHLKYYFPDFRVPKFYAQISGFNQSIVVAQDIVGISLDKYLGEDCKFYSYLGTPMYARKNMTGHRIPQDVILAYGLTEFPFKPHTDNLISNMIYQGKIRYFIMKMMPDISEAVAMKYSDEEYKWCTDNEDLIWGYIIEQKHLFTTEYRTIIKYINDGPFTEGMPSDSPSRTGIWTGLQIVKDFMNKNKDYDLNKLMRENDYEKILRLSAYQP